MAKFWLKSVDPGRQCCGCETKIGPCDTCCSFDLTPLEGEQTTEQNAINIFNQKVIDCKCYVSDPSIKNSISLSSNKIFSNLEIDKKEISFYFTNSYPKNSNGELVLIAKSSLKNPNTQVKPSREDLCSENKVRYNLKPNIDFDIEFESLVTNDGDYLYTDEITEENPIEKKPEDYLEYDLNPDYEQITRVTKVTTEVCCGGKKYTIREAAANPISNNSCANQSLLGASRSFTYRKRDSFGGLEGEGAITISNLRCVNGSFFVDFNGSFTMTKNNGGAFTTVGMSVCASRLSTGGCLIGMGLRLSTNDPVGTTVSSFRTFQITTLSQGRLPLIQVELEHYFGLFSPAYIFIIADCDSIFNCSGANMPEELTLSEEPTCDENFACQKKDNVQVYKYNATSSETNQDSCSEASNTPEGLAQSAQNQIDKTNKLDLNLAGIIGTSLGSLYAAGGIATTTAGVVALSSLGVFGLALAAGLYYYSLQQGANEEVSNEQPQTYQNNFIRGNQNIGCSDVNPGDIIKTVEEYSIVGKRILFNGNPPPSSVLAHAPTYKITRKYSTSNGACVRIKNSILKKESQSLSSGGCFSTNSGFDSIKFGFEATLSNDKVNNGLFKKIFIKVNKKRFNC